jgi:hypothetical protein
VGFTVRLPSDRPYRGVLDGFTVDRSGGYSGLGGDPDEILLKHAVNKAGGLPGMYDDLCQVFAPRASDDGIALLLLAKYGSEFLDSQYATAATASCSNSNTSTTRPTRSPATRSHRSSPHPIWCSEQTSKTWQDPRLPVDLSQENPHRAEQLCAHVALAQPSA